MVWCSMEWYGVWLTVLIVEDDFVELNECALKVVDLYAVIRLVKSLHYLLFLNCREIVFLRNDSFKRKTLQSEMEFTWKTLT